MEQTKVEFTVRARALVSINDLWAAKTPRANHRTGAYGGESTNGEVGFGSDPENLRLSISSPLWPPIADIERTCPEVRDGPTSDIRQTKTPAHSAGAFFNFY